MENFSLAQRKRWLFGTISICCFAVSAAANAQTAQPAPAQKPDTPTNPSADVPLSKKLNQNDGVIKPPQNVDPEIHQSPPAPTGDKMPVIKPPGEPGGDQSIQPK